MYSTVHMSYGSYKKEVMQILATYDCAFTLLYEKKILLQYDTQLVDWEWLLNVAEHNNHS